MWWFDLNTPDDFAGNWYGELTNQMGHTLLGLVCMASACIAWREVFGEMPVRSWAFGAVFLTYAVLVEWMLQRWKPGDSWFDSVMFGFGAAVVLPFREIEVSGDVTAVALDHRYLLGIIAAWAVLLFFRVRRRYLASEVTHQ